MLEIRIIEVFKESGMSRQEFAALLGISNAVLSHISSGRNKAGAELIVGLLQKFPEIDPDWLLFGKGEMKRQNQAAALKAKQMKIKSKLTDLNGLLNKVRMELEKLESELDSDH